MQINILQNKLVFGAEYQITVDNEERYVAKQKAFSFKTGLQLIEKSTGQIKFEIKKGGGWFKLKYNLIKEPNQVLELKRIGGWKGYFECLVNEDVYELHAHKGRKYSVFKNSNQMAWWDKNAVSWFGGDRYKIIADSNADIELLISFCLAIDVKSGGSEGSALTYDFGHIGSTSKKFDRSWRPKY
ncbi:MAG: hypothetical protein AB8B72_13595 [Crocinitomicaceae bacterium]